MYMYAHFYTFSYNMIIDSKSLNQPIYFVLGDCRFKLHAPYKSYPYNHDFSFKPLVYINSKGVKVRLPISKGICSYPMYDEKTTHIGMYVQQNEVFNFKDAMELRLSEDVSNNHFGYSPVDTIRFDTTKQFNNDSPKFLSNFISHLRNISGQFWIGKPRLDNEGVTIEGIVKTNGTLDQFSFHSNLISIFRYNKGVPIDINIWKEAIFYIVEDVDVDFARTLFMDAVYEYANNNHRSVVLNLANSVDISLNKFFKSLIAQEDSIGRFDRHTFVKKYRSNEKVSSTYVPGLIGEFLSNLIGFDYRAENPDNFEIFKVFWLSKRNTVAHGGHVSLEEKEALKLFDAVDDLTEWLNSIDIANVDLRR